MQLDFPLNIKRFINKDEPNDQDFGHYYFNTTN